MIAVTFPDGARREFSPGITGLEIAKGISPCLGLVSDSIAASSADGAATASAEGSTGAEATNSKDSSHVEVTAQTCFNQRHS